MSREYIYTKRLVGGILKLILSAVEGVLRLVYLMLPLGLYMLFMQLRNKMPKATAISSYITDKSEWQFVYSGTMIVMLEPNSLKERAARFNTSVINYVNRNMPWLILWAVIIVTAAGVKILF